MRKLLMAAHICFITVAAPLAALADQSSQVLDPDYFAYSAPLSDSENSLRELILPQHLMENIQRSDFGDLRVFNGDGQILPHEFKLRETEDISSEKALTFYPFNQQQAVDPANIRIQILQNAGKQSIDINKQEHNTTAPGNHEYQYIIENTQRALPLCALKLSWQQARKSLIIPLDLDSSNDLKNWSSLNPSATISKLDYAGSLLIQPDISFPCTTQKFIRLTWKKPEQNIQLKSIAATYRQSGSTSI